MSVEQKSEGLGTNILSTRSSNLGIQGTSTYRKTYHEWRVVSMTVMEKKTYDCSLDMHCHPLSYRGKFVLVS